MTQILEIGIVGDWNLQMPSHPATEAALAHAAAALSAQVSCSWVPTRRVEAEGADATVARFDALWCAPGSPYQSMTGALLAIRYARERNRPFLAT